MSHRTFEECVNILPGERVVDLWRIRFHRGDGVGPPEGYIEFFVGETLKEVTEVFEAKFPYATILSDGVSWSERGVIAGKGFWRLGLVHIVDTNRP